MLLFSLGYMHAPFVHLYIPEIQSIKRFATSQLGNHLNSAIIFQLQFFYLATKLRIKKRLLVTSIANIQKARHILVQMLHCSSWSLLSAVRNLHLRKARKPESVLPVLPNGDNSLCPWMLEGAQLPKGKVTCHVLPQKLSCCLHCLPYSACCFGNALADQGRAAPAEAFLILCSWNGYLSPCSEQRS